MEQNNMEQTKIGEIHIIVDETKPAPMNGSVAFIFSEKLTEDIEREENKDLKDRIIGTITMLQNVLVELQGRVKVADEEKTCID